MKRILSLMLVFCMAVSALPAAFAEEPAAEKSAAASEETPAEYTEDVPAAPAAAPGDDIITSGAFRYKRNADGSAVIVGGGTQTDTLVIPETIDGHPVTAIGSRAFEFSSVKSVTIPDSVTNIGNFAFRRSGLTQVTLPAKLENLGNCAFYKCEALKTVWIPKTLETVNEYWTGPSIVETPFAVEMGPFEACSALESITLEEGIKAIPDYLFASIPAQSPMKTVVLPESTEKIGLCAFTECDSIESIVLPAAVSSTDTPFTDCDSLKSIVFTEKPSGILLISGLAMRCPALETITLARGVGSINGLASDCGKLTEIRIPDTCTDLWNSLTENCGALTDVYIPASVGSINGPVASDPAKVTIHGSTGSQAQLYAQANGYRFADSTVHSTSIQFKKDRVKVTTGARLPLEYTLTPANATDPVTWEFSDPEMFSMICRDYPNALGKAGTGYITVHCGSASDTIEVEVADCSIIHPELPLVGQTFGLEVTAYTADGVQTVPPEQLTWSLEEGNAQVTPDGQVTVLQPGYISVRAQAPAVFDYSSLCTRFAAVREIQKVTDFSKLETEHPYNGSDEITVWEYTLPGVKGFSMTFDALTEFGENDRLTIVSKKINVSKTYTADELAGKSVMIEGDTVQLLLDNFPEGQDGWGFKVNGVTERKGSWELNEAWHEVYRGEDGNLVTGMQLIGDQFYIFDDNGELQKGDEDGNIYAFGNLYCVNPERYPSDPNTYYIMRNHKRVREGVGVTYYDIYGITYVGWVESKDDAGNPVKYYQTRVNADGEDLYIYVWRNQYIPEWINPVTKEVTPAGLYLFGDDGVLVTEEGWYRNETWPEGDNMYYVQQDGTAATGVRYIDGEFYIFGDDGRLLTGDENGDQMYNGNLYYYPEGQRCFVRNYSRVRPGVGITYYNNEGITYVGWVSSTDAEGNPIRLYQTKVNVDGKDLYIYVWRAQQIPEWTNPVTGEVTPAGFYLFGDDGILITEDGIYECGDGNTYVVEDGVIVSIIG